MKLEMVKKVAIGVAGIAAKAQMTSAFVTVTSPTRNVSAKNRNSVKVKDAFRQVKTRNAFDNHVTDSKPWGFPIKNENSEKGQRNINTHHKLISALESARKEYALKGNGASLIKIIKQAKIDYNSEVKRFIDSKFLIHKAISDNNKKLFIELVKAKANINKADNSGRTPLHYAVKSDTAEFSRFLINKGADVNPLDINLSSPLHYASEKGNVNVVANLVMNGANLFQKNSSNFTPFIASFENAETRKFLLLSSIYLQAHEIKTGGLPPFAQKMEKEHMIGSLINKIPKKDIPSMERSFDIEQHMQNRDISIEDRREILKSEVKNMENSGFIWLSNGSEEHAIDMIIKRNNKGNLSLTISNRGLGYRAYHEQDESHKIYYKTIEYEPDIKFESAKDKINFELQLIDSVAEISKKGLGGEEHNFNVDDYYKSIEKITNYKPYVMRFAKVKKDGKTMLPQFADNCATKSMLGALQYLYPDNFRVYKREWLKDIENTIHKIVPSITRNDFKQLIKKQDNWAEEDWTFMRGTALAKHAESINYSKTEKAKTYVKALNYLNKFLEFGQRNKSHLQKKGILPEFNQDNQRTDWANQR